ncbi:cation:proton antiporter regulatory subunit [Micromonospora sp. DR5-3]|uniref:cation:proton antiporter regulatory subunit n=1 Tax=unclassified Micromonospora TaxID=2617518 RepID=UPI0011D398A2|nr:MULTISPECIES: TrkA C-terminal domain-containing protein [unclassified Micromonospora]MCW3814026.1 cation:proton antiporter regulatory subunit [Micromonospora sp. DR5-3]TYC23621.1 cation:proton antiporter regulatory subunit [Micromonospora sp. MP36]
MTIERIALPGVGIGWATTTRAGRRLGVVCHLTGRRDLVVYDPDDAERALSTVVLDQDEARWVADVLDPTVTVDHLTELERQVDGVAAVRLRLPANSPYAGRPLGDTRARSRTGASIVAVVRGDRVIVAPAPDFVLCHDDTLVAVADRRRVAALADLLTGHPTAGR